MGWLALSFAIGSIIGFLICWRIKSREVLHQNGELERVSSLVSDVHRSAQEAIRQTDELIRDRDKHKLRGDRHFDLIVSLEQQRNVWRDMWRAASAAHLRGQNELETRLIYGRTLLEKAIGLLNGERKARGAPCVERPEHLDEPVLVAARFESELAQIAAMAPMDLDAQIERSAIEASLRREKEAEPGKLTVDVEDHLG